MGFINDTQKEQLTTFVKFVIKELGIKNPPRIQIQNGRGELKTTANYDYMAKEKIIKVNGKNRALVDIMRSLSHEISHHKQWEEGKLEVKPPDIGGPIEDDANAKAGQFIKRFALEDPTIYESKKKQVVITEAQLKKLKFNILSEEEIGFFNAERMNRSGGKSFIKVDVFLNPQTVRNMKPFSRAMLDVNGNLYFSDDGGEIIHHHLCQYLSSKGFPIPEDYYHHLDKCVPIERQKNTNNFYLGEILYDLETPNSRFHEYYKSVKKIVERAQNKNPQYKFIMEVISGQ